MCPRFFELFQKLVCVRDQNQTIPSQLHQPYHLILFPIISAFVQTQGGQNDVLSYLLMDVKYNVYKLFPLLLIQLMLLLSQHCIALIACYFHVFKLPCIHCFMSSRFSYPWAPFLSLICLLHFVRARLLTSHIVITMTVSQLCWNTLTLSQYHCNCIACSYVLIVHRLCQ